MLPVNNITAICFGTSSLLLSIISICIMCKQQVTAEPELEQGRQQLTNMPSNHTSSSTAPSITPGGAPSLLQDVIDDGSDPIRAMPQRPLELYRVFSDTSGYHHRGARLFFQYTNRGLTNSGIAIS